MEGTIGVGPAPSGGNEFWITLPLEAVMTPAVPALTQALPAPRRRRAALLLVEDIPANHIVTATLLRREGHRVDIAESGPEAIRLARERPYDLIFMDLIMPGMNGYEAARRIRALPAPTRQVPIVALTANTAPEDRARCIEAGMNDMIGKPVRPAELNEILNRLIWPEADRPAVAATPPVRLEIPAIDAERLADLRRGLPAATMTSLVEQCLLDMRKRVPQLQQALIGGNATAIDEAAHALAGMAGTYGMVAVERRMRRVMAAARRNDIVDATIGADGMEGELDRAGQAIYALLRDRAA
jgi:CheY-like chemotaxis protein